jgi:hypothetical protein
MYTRKAHETQRLGVFLLTHPAVSAFPDMAVGSARALSFSRFARRFTRVAACTLARSPYIVTRYPKASATSLPP